MSSMIAQALAEFDESKKAIAVVRQYGTLTLAVDGIGKVEEAHKQVKRLRIDITKRGKDLRDGANAYNKAVIAEEKRLISEIEPIEDALAAQRKIHDDAEKKRLEEKHAARRAVLTGRIEKLAQAGCVAGDVAALELMSDDEFSLHFIQEARRAETARQEAEAARMEAEKREADRIAENERQTEELRVRRAEMEADRKALEAEREAMLHNQAVQRKQLEEQQAEVRRQQEEIRAEVERKADAERQRLLAERKAEDERLSKIAADEAEAAMVARMEALKPEIEKAALFMQAVDNFADDYLTKIGRPVWSESALVSIERACIEIRRNVERGEL